jgi:hypothetical protein
MRGIALLRIVLAVVALNTLPAVASAQCVTFDKPEEFFARSEVVFRGTVVATKATGAQGDHQIVDIATFMVKESWKGNPAREVQVRADQPFEKSKEYVVFAGGTPFSTSIECRWTEPIERAKAKLDWLRKNRLASKPRASTSAPRSKTE